VPKRLQCLTSLGPLLFAGCGDTVTWCWGPWRVVVAVAVVVVVVGGGGGGGCESGGRH